MRSRRDRHPDQMRSARVTWWEIALWSIPASLPGLWLYRWGQARAARRTVDDIKAYRRAKFGGAIRKPGQIEVETIERPIHEDR